MTNPVINIDAVPTIVNQPPGTRFGSVMAIVGDALGMQKLGCMYMQVEPGKRAYPYHNHHANEEMFIILEGTGTYRFGDQQHPIKSGDICSAPAGGRETAHQIINTGGVTLRYLSISTRLDPEICEYPDSDKYSAFSLGTSTNLKDARLKAIGRTQETLGYFDGEDM